MAVWEELAEELKETKFISDFLEIYIRNGFGSLPKREIDLHLLELVFEHHPGWDEHTPSFEIARTLRVSQRRVRNMLDDLAFRDESKTDEWCANKLIEILLKAEILKDDSGVRFQIDDGLIREFAISIIRKGYGIVDSSFNSAIIKLSADQFAALTIQLLNEGERAAVLATIPVKKRNAQQDEQKTKGPLRLFVDSFMSSAGEEAGKKTVKLGFALLSGGWSELSEIAELVKEYLDVGD